MNTTMRSENTIKRVVRLMLTLAFVFMLSGLTLAAAAPAKVKTLKATAGESSVTLKWSKVSGADGYFIYTQVGSGTIKRAATVKGGTKKTVTIKKLVNGTTYNFYISAYKKSGKTTLTGEKKGPIACKPRIDYPGRVNLKMYANGSQKVVLSWAKKSKASYYEIYQKNSAGTFVRIGTTKKTDVTISNLTNGVEYSFKVRAVRKVSGKVAYGGFSNVATGKPAKLKADLSQVHRIYYKSKIVNVGKSITLTSTDKKKKKTLKAGTSVIVSDYVRGGTSTIKVGNYFYKISTSKLASLSGYSYNGKLQYSKATAEAYVNYKGYKSASKYFIWISTYTQRLYIFQGSKYNWKLIRTCKCSTGQWGWATPFGFSTMGGRDYKWWFGEYQFAYYASHIRGGAIHSELYYPGGTTKYTGVGTLGNPASHGCVRVEKSNAEWIFYNCAPVHTEVLVY